MSMTLNSVASTNEDMRPERKQTGNAIPYSFKKQILSTYEMKAVLRIFNLINSKFNSQNSELQTIFAKCFN